MALNYGITRYDYHMFSFLFFATCDDTILPNESADYTLYRSILSEVDFGTMDFFFFFGGFCFSKNLLLSPYRMTSPSPASVLFQIVPEPFLY